MGPSWIPPGGVATSKAGMSVRSCQFPLLLEALTRSVPCATSLTTTSHSLQHHQSLSYQSPSRQTQPASRSAPPSHFEYSCQLSCSRTRNVHETSETKSHSLFRSSDTTFTSTFALSCDLRRDTVLLRGRLALTELHDAYSVWQVQCMATGSHSGATLITSRTSVEIQHYPSAT